MSSTARRTVRATVAAAGIAALGAGITGTALAASQAPGAGDEGSADRGTATRSADRTAPRSGPLGSMPGLGDLPAQVFPLVMFEMPTLDTAAAMPGAEPTAVRAAAPVDPLGDDTLADSTLSSDAVSGLTDTELPDTSVPDVARPGRGGEQEPPRDADQQRDDRRASAAEASATDRDEPEQNGTDRSTATAPRDADPAQPGPLGAVPALSALDSAGLFSGLGGQP